MKKLVLEKIFAEKLARLPDRVGDLTYLGDNPNSLAELPIIAIVGTRKLSPYGTQVTQKIAEDLVRAGVVVVSGLAYGADITAHKAALAAGGKTIAVLPSGLENIYPASHASYAKKISENGCLISEYEANRMPRKVEFLERNRIIAALSDAVIIPEAAERSGSLNTAGHAESMGVPVFAVPGPITSTLSAGTNALIKSGKARMITEAKDVLTALNITGSANAKTLEGSTPEETIILQYISEGCHDLLQLQERSGMATINMQTTITMLEIGGRIKQDSIGNWHLA